MFGRFFTYRRRIGQLFALCAALALTAGSTYLLQKNEQLIGGGINRLIVFLLINAHILILVGLLYAFIRKSITFFNARSQENTGYVFKRTIIITLLFLSVIPSLIITVIAGKVITESITIWFNRRISSGLNSGIALHQAHTAALRAALMQEGTMLLNNVQKASTTVAMHQNPVIHQIYYGTLSNQTQQKQLNNEIKLWRQYRKKNSHSTNELYRSFIRIIKEGHKKSFCFDFYGSLYWIGFSNDHYLILAHRYPQHIRDPLIAAHNAYADYMQLKKLKRPIINLYLLLYCIIAFIIIILALWSALHIIDDITQALKHNTIKTWQEAAKQIAHEIKNPLTPIQLAAQRLHKKYASPLENQTIFNDCITTIVEQVSVIKELIAHFADFASLPKPTLTPCVITEIIEDVATIYRTSYPSLTIQTRHENQFYRIISDSDSIKRCLTNLFDNSIRALTTHTPITQKPTITITTRKKADTYTIYFQDNGPGIAPAIRDTLFLPYVSTEKKNMGLGLAIVRDTIRLLGGSIILDTHAHNTTFVITLPCRPPF